MDDPSTPRVRPLPVSPATALLLGAARWSLHLAWGGAALVVLGIVIGISAENGWVPPALEDQVTATDLDTLSRALIGAALLIPLPAILAHLVLTILGVGALRRTAARDAEQGRPSAAERHALAYSPASRAAKIAQVWTWIMGGLTVLFAITAIGMGGAEGWYVTLGAFAICALCYVVRRAALAARPQSDRAWDETRSRWPAAVGEPRAFSLAEDDVSLGHSRLSGCSLFFGFAAIIVFVWGFYQVDEGDGLEVVLGESITPIHLAGVGLVLMVLLGALEWILFLTRETSKYRAFARDPERAARRRVERNKDPDVTTACARAVLRRHPLPTYVAIPLTAIGATLTALPLAEITVAITPEGSFTGEIATVLRWAAVPGIVLLLAGLALFTSVAHALPVHRSRLLTTFRGLDPVVARVEHEVSGENGKSKRTSVVYGDHEGDPDIFERDTNDDPR